MPSRTEPKATSSPPSSAILEQTLRGHQGIVTSIAFNPANLNGRLNSDVSSGKNDSDECSIGVGNDIASLHNEERCQHHSTRQPHQQIASSAYDGTIMVWNMHGRLNGGVGGKPGHRMNEERVRAYRLIGHTGPVHKIAYSPSGKTLASCSSDHTVRLWVPSLNFSKGESVVLRGHNGTIRCVDFGPSLSSPPSSQVDSTYLSSEALMLTCSDDKTIKLWSLPQTTFRASFVGHTNWVRVAKFAKVAPGAIVTTLAASGGDDFKVRIWDCERGMNLATYDYCGGNQSYGGVRDVEFLPSATSLAAGGTNGVKIYDLRSDSLVQELNCVHFDSNGVTSARNIAPAVDSLSIHPNGIHLLCSASDSAKDGRVIMWDIRHSAKTLFEIPSIGSIGSPNSKKLNSPPSRSGRCVASVGCPSTSVFSSDGSQFAMSLKENCARVYNWNGGSLPIESSNTHITEDASGKSHKAKTNICKSKKLQQAKAKEVVTEDLITNEEVRCHEDPARKVQIKNGNNVFISDNENQNTHEIKINPQQDHQASTLHPISSLKYNKTHLPELLSGTLDRIVGQLDILAQTVIMLEQRLSIQEYTIDRIQKQTTNTWSNDHVCNNDKEKTNQLQKPSEKERNQQVQSHSHPRREGYPSSLLNIIGISSASKQSCDTNNTNVEFDISTIVDQKINSLLQTHSCSSSSDKNMKSPLD